MRKAAFFDYIDNATREQGTLAQAQRAAMALREHRLTEGRQTSEQQRWEGEGGNSAPVFDERNRMDWESIRSNWRHYLPFARAQWTQITERELELIDGQREVLAEHISVVYGISGDEARSELASWQGQQRAIELDP
jgi:hypothetical protein